MSWLSKFSHKANSAAHFVLGASGSPMDAKKFDQEHGSSVKHYKLWSTHNARQDEQAAANAAKKKNQSVAQNVDDLRTLFGVYQGTDAQHQGDSATNASSINQNYDHYKQAYLDYFSPQLQDQVTTASHNDLFAGINSGTAGGSADQLRQQGTLNKYVTAQQQLGAKANTARNDLASSDQERELSLEDQLRHGGDASYLMSTGYRDSIAHLNAAQDSIAGNTIGDVFNNAGNLYDQSQQAQAYGRRGLSFAPSGSATASGTLTGS